MNKIMINNNNNQDWNSTLLLWYQLTHYSDISDIWIKSRLIIIINKKINKFIILQKDLKSNILIH